MFLIDKTGVRPVCWPCGKVHGKQECPRRRKKRTDAGRFLQALAEHYDPQRVDWRDVERSADEFCTHMDAYWGRRLARFA
jgi:hypothetical protein